ncbi:hypothetical protein PMAYCL1PPCAC_20551, partial [Pristionchus mayeri]
ELLEEPCVDAETDGGVRGLPGKAGAQPGVDRSHALVSDDGRESVDRTAVLPLAAGAGKLHAVLDEVKRLHDESRAHSGGSAEQELDRVGNGLCVGHDC